MLQKFGVQGVKVHEIVSLNDDFLTFLPCVRPNAVSLFDITLTTSNSRPVYGLIFLFKWLEEDPNKQEQSCPNDIWFANQVSFQDFCGVTVLTISQDV